MSLVIDDGDARIAVTVAMCSSDEMTVEPALESRAIELANHPPQPRKYQAPPRAFGRPRRDIAPRFSFEEF